MPQATNRTQLTLHNSVLEPLKPYIPERKSLTQFVEDLLEKQIIAIDARNRLGKPNDNEVLPLNKAVNKEKDVDFSLRAEEAHIDVAAIKSPPKVTKEIPGNLFGHEDLIRAYWKVKPKNKTAAAWKLLMTELTKIQDAHGDSPVRSQLELAEANRWQGITLANYERFGLPRTNTSKQADGIDYAALDAIRTPW